MALDPIRDEQERQEYERSYNIDRANELEQYKRAVQMLVMSGDLKQERWQQALDFVKGGKR